MRISSSWSHQTAVNAMLKQQATMQQTQLQLTTGKKILTASDDPIATGRILDLKQNIQQSEQFQDNIETARGRLSMSEGVLQSATDILQRINELGVLGLNDSFSTSDRSAIAAEMEELNTQMLSLANTKAPSGEYLFSGYKSKTLPFSQSTSNPGAYEYAGDDNARHLQIEGNRQIADGNPGSSVFGVPTGPAPATVPAAGSITNIFEAIDKFAADLRANTPSSDSLDDIAKSLDTVVNVRASIGIRLNALDKQEEIHADSVLEMKTVLSSIEDVDYTEAISRFSQQSVSLQAAQQTFSKLKELTLFNYL
jgi:flagellar hook-associated protein 3 FlgL